MERWPEQLVVYHFKARLDQMFQQACACRGLALRLVAWFQAAMKLDIEFWDK